MYNLALLYKNGNGCKKDLIKAKEFFEKAAKLGHKDGNFFEVIYQMIFGK